MREDFLSVIAARGDTQIKQNEGLATYSTFKIGGEARYAIFPENKNALVFAVQSHRLRLECSLRRRRFFGCSDIYKVGQ